MKPSITGRDAVTSPSRGVGITPGKLGRTVAADDRAARVPSRTGESMMSQSRFRPALVALVVLAGCCLPAIAFAQSASTTFDVTITIDSTCSIDTPAATDVDFGLVDSTATDVEADGLLNVNCTPGTDYEIALDPGLNGATIADRAMSNGAVLVPYQLYRDPALTLVWGETLDVDTLGGTGTGAVQEIPVYGQVPSANFPADTYTDTVTATITY